MAGKNYRAELVGVFGDPVDDNPTVVVEESAFAALGLNWRYITFRVPKEGLRDAMAALRACGMRGINLTMPHKVEVLRYLDEVSESASIIGAVNTVVVKGGRLFGENTDGKGFVRSLHDEGISLTDAVVTILGAGGAARAVAVECALAGARHIHVVNRDTGRGSALSDLVASSTPAGADYIPWNGRAQVPGDTAILINATPVGLGSDECPDVDTDGIRADMTVCDVVFNPAETAFLKKAKARGARTVSGLGMLVSQGALNFELWTGSKAPYSVMYDALLAEFEGPRRIPGVS